MKAGKRLGKKSQAGRGRLVVVIAIPSQTRLEL